MPSKLFFKYLSSNILIDNNSHILEIGCGYGIAAEFTSHLPCFLLLTDINQNAITYLIHRWKHNHKIHVLHTDSAHIKGHFDVIYYFLSLHHIDDITSELINSMSLLNNHGQIFICEIEPRNNVNFHKYDIVPHDGLDSSLQKSTLRANGFDIVDHRNIDTIESFGEQFIVYCIIAKIRNEQTLPLCPVSEQ